MLMRFAPLVPLALVTLLIGCAAQSPVSQQQAFTPAARQPAPLTLRPHASPSPFDNLESDSSDDDAMAAFSGTKAYQLPMLADSILERGKSLIGTRYRFGGTTEAGFDCSGFVNFLFREQAGMTLPRSSRELVNLDAPVVARNNLKPGDVLFFGTHGRGRVSHTGIYLGDDQFIHSSSSRSGGVRIDNLDDNYWKKTYIEAKRLLAMAPAATLSNR
ncbi:C40 family peptidase [Pseudomonas typographi]|uniref:Peptidase P60 n=1 Tax=Pseudomonas typographi TaxID=2715964 RepID=A0ABR7Z0R6_9PSED|nr:NlpC/P60 family protein [Pseudomonas typographi]MBD1550711.1 peptidase P60 [Pseudomonas typographi]MBD1589319.1 peptidase P60 [Pseudomonas typographi]MBD1598997.1 peptidase P60 [Pseudomonas typographi]